MQKLVIAVMVLLSVFSAWAGSDAQAQESASVSKQNSEDVNKPVNAYRLDFTIHELDEGKKINARQYSLNLNSGDADEVKIGTRVPVEMKQGEMQYIDVGTSIWCRIRGERGNDLELMVRAEISNFAIPEQQSRSNSMPLLRQLRINASTLLVPGRPMVVGSVDDPNSKREFQLEVTANKLK